MSKKEWLQKSKSYLSEVVLETVESEYSKSLTVSMLRGRYQLHTEKVIYSYEDLYHNFRVTANKIDWVKFKPASVLVLGLGLGSVIQIVEKKTKPPLDITAVEIDEAILYLFNKYISPSVESPIEFIIADAYHFIYQNTRKYDLILFDIFIDDLIPPKFESLAFTKKLVSSLSPHGLVLYNRVAIEPNQIMGNMHHFENVFLKVFPHAHFLDIKTNWVLVSDKRYLKT
ncbi:MAG: hypothetical protein ABI761_11125 [Saprospiraceae bacterium]